MKNKLSFRLPGNPQSTNTIYRRQNRGTMYMTKKGRDMKNLYIAILSNGYKGPIIETEVHIDVKLYFKDRIRRDIDKGLERLKG